MTSYVVKGKDVIYRMEEGDLWTSVYQDDILVAMFRWGGDAVLYIEDHLEAEIEILKGTPDDTTERQN